MTITYPLDLPAAPSAPARIRLVAEDVVGMSVSPFTAEQQVYEHPGKFWRAEVELPAMTRDTAEPWAAFLVALKGRRGTFRMGDPAARTPRGAATGTPLVLGAGQAGALLVTDGWTAGVTGILKAGDYLQLEDRLYKVLQNASSNGSGQATFDIWPNLRSSPADNAALTVFAARGLWRLAANERGWSIGASAFFDPLAFGAVEAL